MKIGFIGTGNMGSALASAVAKSLPEANLFFSDFAKEKAFFLAEKLSGIATDNLSMIKDCDLVFLGVKPQVLPQLLLEISDEAKKRQGALTLVTMAAGVQIKTITDAIPSCPVIRIMPNTPVLVGEGVVAYCLENVSQEVETIFVSALSSAGLVEKIAESKIDAASALHGCGPAFAYLFIDALAEGAVSCGLSRQAALRFATQTVKGSAEMLLSTGEEPEVLAERVCSPGGSTIEGVRTLEKEGFQETVMNAVKASYQRTLELGK